MDTLHPHPNLPSSSEKAVETTATRARARIPRATYRLQFNREFTFAQAAALVPYLHSLGVSHCYASPYLKARPGSMHGYDIIDHASLNPEIGDAEDFERFFDTLKQHDMSQILDVVPNHVGIMGSDNAWWLNVLENGQASVYAEFFDIDWQSPKEELRDKVLAPVLGDQYGKILDNGELKLAFDKDKGEFSIWYYEHRFPVDPKEYVQILGHEVERLTAQMGEGDLNALELHSLVTAFGHLPSRTDLSVEMRAERNRDKEIHKLHFAELCKRSEQIVAFIMENVAKFNGDVNDPKSFGLLHQLIKAQAFRLAYWRVAADDINYRRFFDINDLAALRMEREEVFVATHRLISDLVARGAADGLRIDHPDGLYDPLQYFQRLTCLPFKGEGLPIDREPYVVIEKITASYEHLPQHWPVHGTTGYRFANVVNGLFVNTANEEPMNRIYASFIGERINYSDLVYRCKKLIMGVSLASQLNVLANALSRIALSDRHTCDFTVNSLRDALTEVAACFPVYRTYVTRDLVSDDDKRFIDWAVKCARKKSRPADASVFDFIRAVLLHSIGDGKAQEYRDAVADFAMRFQQFTSPVMAKAMEDTSFYIYNRLVSLNEVGGDPSAFGMTVNAFHGASQARAKHWPHTMLATSTHDGKRSEDVRARINVLSELPTLWRQRVARWSRLNRRMKTALDGNAGPSRNDEYLLYQTLIGVWPLDDADLPTLLERIERYMLKAVREAKVHSSWLNPNTEYEKALSSFVGSLLTAGPSSLFLADFLPFQRMISRFGMFNSLSQTLIKLTSPGLPDIYQGSELWDFSLVDPDNRRSVDYARRQTLLNDLKASFATDPNALPDRVAGLLQNMEDGRIKLYMIWKILAIRAQFEGLFRDGEYAPSRTEGVMSEHLCAFARLSGGEAVITVAPRLFYGLVGESGRLPVGAEIWKDTAIEAPATLSSSQWINSLTGELVTSREIGGKQFLLAAELFSGFPYALLIPSPAL
jgi:(1->4)-alpha-D-glucan 1-alpha-D-glucosylmutase